MRTQVPFSLADAAVSERIYMCIATAAAACGSIRSNAQMYIVVSK